MSYFYLYASFNYPYLQIGQWDFFPDLLEFITLCMYQENRDSKETMSGNKECIFILFILSSPYDGQIIMCSPCLFVMSTQMQQWLN